MQHFFVLTPCLNAASYLDETILSVAAQAGNFSLRYHVQDGGSSDDTVSRLEAWSRQLAIGKWPALCKSLEFSYSSVPDAGIYDAISKGFGGSGKELSTNSMMTWINAGDRLESGALQTVSAIRRCLPDVSWMCGGFAQINDEGSVIVCNSGGTVVSQKAIAAGLYEGRRLGFLQQEGVFWSAGLWKAAGSRMNPDLKLAGDFELWRRLAGFSPCFRVATITGLFRRHEGGLSADLAGYNKEIDNLITGAAAAQRDAMFTEAFRLSDAQDQEGMIREGFTGPVILWSQDEVRWDARMSLISPQRPAMGNSG